MISEKILLLSHLKEGQKVKIVDIKDLYIKNHLGQIGIYPEKQIFVSKISWDGATIAIITDNTEIAIRKDIANNIEVQPV
jgi:Fe2+ transport system protein FeoA